MIFNLAIEYIAMYMIAVVDCYGHYDQAWTFIEAGYLMLIGYAYGRWPIGYTTLLLSGLFRFPG